ncbi:MAG: hypothetical protein CL920_25885 [Deltaproteobacteria bacterium]|nr:hypothetical protein [Deltaproteobacteria bacterium]|tara:strand:+ start:87 stop:908 length:822 start_codon:yes stop_codon:yes gene_type:complete
MSHTRKVGIVGYGRVGRYLVDKIKQTEDMELSFVWNLDPKEIDEGLPVLHELKDFHTIETDLIVEVAHPVISRDYGADFLAHTNYMAGSPTAFADQALEDALRAAAETPNGHGLYIPKGALPGLRDVLDMAADGRLVEADIAMIKAPESINYLGPLDKPLSEVKETTTLYEGPLRKLCEYAPNNVNTMAILALSSGLGFDKVKARLIAEPDLEYHITEVNLWGPKSEDSGRFCLEMKRINPAAKGAVTGNATYRSFWNSVRRCFDAGDGIHFR